MKKKIIFLAMTLAAVAAIGTTAYAASANAQQQGNAGVCSGVNCVLGEDCPNPDCPQITLDETGDTATKQDATVKVTCPYNEDCVNGECNYPDCPNNGVPAKDGTGTQYRGGQTQVTTTDTSTETTTTNTSTGTVTETVGNNPDCPYYEDCVNGTCNNPDCPNNGIPPRDGTGAQYGKQQNGQGNGGNGQNCQYPDCPQDGSGYHGGHGGNGNGYGNGNGNGNGNANGNGNGRGRNQ